MIPMMPQQNKDIEAIKIMAVAGDEVKNLPVLYQKAVEMQTPTQQDTSGFNNWYSNLKQQMPYLPQNPIGQDYNYYGFYKASQNPNSGVSTQINPNDKQIHFSDSYNNNGQTVNLKMPWHNNAWTMYADPMLQNGTLNMNDIQSLNNWNAERLGVPQQYGGW